MTHSEQMNEIGAALAKAEAKVQNAAKTAENPGFKRGNKASTYADLASVWDACRGPLTEYGIAVIQAPKTEGAVVTVETMLVHSSGQWIADALSATAANASPQAVGSAITYLRRYALAAMVGVAPADDDGEAAEGRETPAGRPQEPAANGTPSRADTVKARVQSVAGSHSLRKQEALRDLERLGLDVRAEAAAAVGRTFPVGSDIKLQNEEELMKLEAHVQLRRAQSNQQKAQAN